MSSHEEIVAGATGLLILWILGIFLFFLLVRAIVLWYWRVNHAVDALKLIAANLDNGTIQVHGVERIANALEQISQELLLRRISASVPAKGRRASVETSQGSVGDRTAADLALDAEQERAREAQVAQMERESAEREQEDARATLERPDTEEERLYAANAARAAATREWLRKWWPVVLTGLACIGVVIWVLTVLGRWA